MIELTQDQKQKLDDGILAELAQFIEKKGLVLNESENVSDEVLLKRTDNAIEFLEKTSMRLNASSQQELELMITYYNNRIKLMGEVLVKKYD